ncbi:MAG: fold metallo-hydrolase [Frankiales bacterium]|nr:fold metallo-hydrolase [Frankiales bacterium]
MAAVQVADGVWRIPTAPADFINSYLLQGDDGTLVLVDAGTRSAPRTLLAALAALGRQPGDVTHLLLSHAHNDHTGGAKAVVDATGSRVVTHEREAVYVREGRMPQTDPSTLGGRLLARLPGRATGFARVGVDEEFTDGDVLPLAGGIRVVHTPGHTPGHCSFLHDASGVLITGDAVFNVRGLRYSFRSSCTDVALSRSSAARLGELEFDVAGFTHGPHVSDGAQAAVRAFLAGRPS